MVVACGFPLKVAIMILELTFCTWFRHQKADGLSNIVMPLTDAFVSFSLHSYMQTSSYCQHQCIQLLLQFLCDIVDVLECIWHLYFVLELKLQVQVFICHADWFSY